MANFKLNTNEYLQQCDSKDVISFNSEKWDDINKLKEIIYTSFSHAGVNSTSSHISNTSQLKNSNTWFDKGEECEILRAGSQGWQKGKIKINVSLEFIPDEEEKSPLDDIRASDINSPTQQ